uniref:Putative DNA polymerase beta domain protein region n=1 Tax=Streptosporangium amethystogenes TaxID=2002 RepID=M4ZR30_9ACTN|nr:putative DNA polymerase beta domain protein region [Streptosporangium amethystogenes]
MGKCAETTSPGAMKARRPTGLHPPRRGAAGSGGRHRLQYDRQHEERRTLTSSREIDSAREPWSIARHFANRLAGALDGILRDVVVIGSASLGDWQTSSDIDLVCTVGGELDSRARDAVSPLHGNSWNEYGHTIDAMYVTSEGLAKGPEDIPSVVASVAGTLQAESTDGSLNWVTWLNITQSGVNVPLTADGVMTTVDPQDGRIPIPEGTLREGAVRFSRANLDEYWRNRANLSEQMYPRHRTDQPVPTFEIEWMSLGPARLLATVLTGRIVSKSEGGELAADRFPEFGSHLERVLDSRRGAAPARTWDRGDLERSLELARTCVRLGTA